MKKVTVYKPHTHAGKKLRPGPDGIEIEVSEQDATFLKDAGVLDKPAPPESVPEPGADSAASARSPQLPSSDIPTRPQIATRPQG